MLGCCYITQAQGINIGAIYLPVMRLLLAVGVLRVIIRREEIPGGLNKIDLCVFAISIWMFIASFTHDGVGAGPIAVLGIIFNFFLSYSIIRILCQDKESVRIFILIVAFILFPVALEMLQEQITGTNLFAQFFGGTEEVGVRSGRYRSQGPFRHAILAGTIGATCFPLMIAIWNDHKKVAKLGVFSCLLIVITSSSSGPLMSLLFAVFALVMWKWRHLTSRFLKYALLGYLLLEIVMTRPAYYIISKFDLTGSSTGWHRSRLIETAINHISEWWLFGTDYTRHWMPTGVSWNPDHTDITNYYLQFGVWGGLPALLLLVYVFWTGFKWIGKIVEGVSETSIQSSFFIWCLGACLFAHAVTCISVSYFDQSFFFIWAAIAMVASCYNSYLQDADSFVLDSNDVEELPDGEKTAA